ncbi:DUF6248 family natural product biosynthesis protein [Streptomyces sp. NBC_00237]|uniref:DUF6248 family natural product biosynthesis protein n=1 Tax=Streptomyces sp. NBC_00237 TaxID=2975687 RepID=UPI0033900772
MANRETGRQPPRSPLRDHCGCLIKIDDTLHLHERILPHSDGPFHRLPHSLRPGRTPPSRLRCSQSQRHFQTALPSTALGSHRQTLSGLTYAATRFIPRPDGEPCVWWCRCACPKTGPAPTRPRQQPTDEVQPVDEESDASADGGCDEDRSQKALF